MNKASTENPLNSGAGLTADEDEQGNRCGRQSAGAIVEFVGRYPLLFAAVAFVGGGQGLGVLANAFHLTIPAWALGLAAVLIAAVYFGCLSWRKADSSAGTVHRLVPDRMALLCFMGFFACVGGYRQVVAEPKKTDDLKVWASREPKPIAVRCEILAGAIWKPNPSHRPLDPASEPWMTSWEVRCYEVKNSGAWNQTQALTTLATKGRVSGWLPGDKVECFGSFRSIYPATNPGSFDLAKYSAARGRYVMLSVDHVEQMERLEPSWTRPISRIRARAVEYCDRMLHEHVTHGKAPLAAALVFGQRQQVDWSEQQELMATGTLHMLAISGMHVEIVASGVLGLCWILGFGARPRFVLIASVCIAYALLADGKPPVLRATVLVLAFELARLVGRRARMTNMLSLAAIFLYLVQAQNATNVGVHLSFLAVAAIGIFVVGNDGQEVSAFRKLQLGSMARLPRFLQTFASYVLGLVRLSFWVWIVTCPLVWYHFHVVAPIAIPLNVLISVPLALSLLAGLLTAIFGVVPLFSTATGILCGGALSLITAAIEACESLPGGHLWLPSPPLWWIVLFYSVLSIWLAVFRLKRRRGLALSLCMLVVAAIGMHAGGARGFHFSIAQVEEQPETPSKGDAAKEAQANGVSHRSNPFAVTFLDVGHGTSVIVEMPDAQVWLYDAGHLGAADRSHQEIAEALWEFGTVRIDTLILSHADSDHYNAVAGLAERFQIGRIWTTASFTGSQDRPVAELLQVLECRGIPVLHRTAGERGVRAGVEWKVLHPDGERFESDNASSLCLQMEYRGKRVLLPGDLDGMGMYRLLELPERPCHALMAPHHGSLTKDPTDMLQWCRPELVVISGNHRAVRPAVVERYAPQTETLGITFRDGAIRWAVHGDGETMALRWNADQWEPLSADVASGL